MKIMASAIYLFDHPRPWGPRGDTGDERDWGSNDNDGANGLPGAKGHKGKIGIPDKQGPPGTMPICNALLKVQRGKREPVEKQTGNVVHQGRWEMQLITLSQKRSWWISGFN